MSEDEKEEVQQDEITIFIIKYQNEFLSFLLYSICWKKVTCPAHIQGDAITHGVNTSGQGSLGS